MTRRDRGIVAAAFACQAVAIGTTIGAYSLFVRPVAETFGASTLQVSAGISLITLTLGMCGIPVGTWLDRGSPRRVMLTGAAILTSGLLLGSLASSPWQLAAVCVLVGAGIPMLGPLTTAAVVGKAVHAERGRALGLANMGLPAGGLAFALVAAFVIDAWGWRAALRVFAAMALLVAVPSILRGIPADLGSAPGAPGTPRGPLPAAFRTRLFWLCATVLGVGVGTNAGWVPHLAPFLEDLGAGSRTAGALVAIAQGLAIVGTLVFGSLADRRSSTGLLTTILAIQLGCFALYLLEPGLAAVTAVVAVFGVTAGGFMPVYAHLLAERFGPESLGRAMGLSNLMLLPFGFGLPMVAGAMRDAQDSYQGAILLCALLLALGIAVLGALRLEIRRAGPAS